MTVPSANAVIRSSRLGSCDTLNDLAWIAVRALGASIAVIAFNDAALARTGCAAAPGDPWVRAHPSTDLASLVDPRIAGNLGLQCYAAVPARNQAGEQIGTVVVLRQNTSVLSDDDLAVLHRFARVAEVLAQDS